MTPNLSLKLPVEKYKKCTHLELRLGQIANYCPVISRNTIVKTSTSMSSIWQAIRLHLGFQSTGAHFLDFNNITLAPAEHPEDLYQRLMSFIEDNLLLANGITHTMAMFLVPTRKCLPL